MFEDPAVFFLFPDCFKTEKMCNEAVKVDPWQLIDVPHHFKTQKMCDDAVWGDPFSLQFVPDWFVTQGQIKIWYNDAYYCNDDLFINLFSLSL